MKYTVPIGTEGFLWQYRGNSSWGHRQRTVRVAIYTEADIATESPANTETWLSFRLPSNRENISFFAVAKKDVLVAP